MTEELIAPTQLRFIKLGEQGRWEKSCIEEGTIRLGYESDYHKESLAGDWDVVRAFWLSVRSGPMKESTATRDINQVKDFYELDGDTLWITFYNRKLWWCFAQKEVIELDEDKSRIRYTVNGWSCKDLRGRDLSIESLDGRVTTVQGYRGTICGINSDVHDYLINKINGKSIKEVEDALVHLDNLKSTIALLIQGMHWKDFELLADLIFSQAGWQRSTELGKTQKSVDIDIRAPVTGRRAFVQVKSNANLHTLEETIEQFKEMEGFDDLFFVVHTSDKGIKNFKTDDTRIHILDRDRLAELVINAGLVQWLINKRS